MGAMARIGIVCEAMIQGISERSSVGTCTMPSASTQPRAVPSTKPSMAEESVTQPW